MTPAATAKPRVAIIGASIGGLVAASALNKRGFGVTIFEKNSFVGGLYSKAKTPYGERELGMHVLYLSKEHFQHLCDIFGRETFNVLTDYKVDVGACVSASCLSFNSHYPNIIKHPKATQILDQIIASEGKNRNSTNAHEEASNRFGSVACEEIVAPILEKLWQTRAKDLTKQALNCYFDLRRMVVCEKEVADRLKSDPWLDNVVANPTQSKPRGQVFGGRIGVTIVDYCGNLEERVSRWVESEGVSLQLEKNICLEQGALLVDGIPVSENFDACIVAVPLHSFDCEKTKKLNRLELSIYYLQLKEKLLNEFPAYYVLCHDPALKASRIIHYDAYRPENPRDKRTVIAVEAIHGPGSAPAADLIEGEVSRVFPNARVLSSFRLPNSLPVIIPSLANKILLDAVKDRIERSFGQRQIYFTGMRTDTGIFFSHHTIGLAYDSALDCCKRLL